jgi:hypothetical protein
MLSWLCRWQVRFKSYLELFQRPHWSIDLVQQLSRRFSTEKLLDNKQSIRVIWPGNSHLPQNVLINSINRVINSVTESSSAIRNHVYLVWVIIDSHWNEWSVIDGFGKYADFVVLVNDTMETLDRCDARREVRIIAEFRLIFGWRRIALGLLCDTDPQQVWNSGSSRSGEWNFDSRSITISELCFYIALIRRKFPIIGIDANTMLVMRLQWMNMKDSITQLAQTYPDDKRF